jgi:transcriptional regulator with XRE-family HTH domain
MRKRISSKTDYNILADVSLGLTSKEIAKKYGVSVSYVSKVRTGRKKIEVYIPEQTKKHGLLDYYETDIEKIAEFFEYTSLSLAETNLSTLDGLIIEKLTELKTLLAARKIIKEKEK